MSPDSHEEVFAKAFAEAWARSLDEVERRCHLPVWSSAHPGYPDWVHDQVRFELRRVREAVGKSPYAIAVPGTLTKDTVRNIENGTHSPTMKTLAVYCQRLGTSVDTLVVDACRKK